MPQHRHQRGFSLLELVIALSLIAILVGVVTFRSSAVLEKGRVSSLIQLAKNMQTACLTYHSDTGSYPREIPGGAPAARDLSTPQTTVAGWAGPYLDKPLANPGSNPYGDCRLGDDASAWSNPGFDLDGDGSNDVTGDASMLRLDGIEEAIALRIDDALDKGVAGAWQSSGVVNYDAGARRLFVLVYY